MAFENMPSTDARLPVARTETVLARVLLAAALLFGAWPRLNQFSSQTLLDDEWHTVHQLVRSTPSQFLLTHGAADHSIAMTAYNWLLLNSVGLSETGMRLPALLAGLASMLLLPLLLRGTLGGRVVGVAVLLVAISPLLINYSRMARPYALTLLLSLVALAWLDRGTAAGRARWCWIGAAAFTAALAVWLHALVVPLLVAPLLALALQTLRGRGLRGPALAGVLLLMGGAMTLALLPPLLHDLGALAAKAGRDLPRLSTLQGVFHVWLGTASTPLVLLGLLLASFGAGPVWRSGVVVRWTIGGLLLTLLVVLLVRPAWVFNPLTFGRYLLPALPLWLMAIAAGLVRLVDLLIARIAPARDGEARIVATTAPALLLSVGLVATSPTPTLLAAPNSNTQHYYYQFDYRPSHNPVVPAFDAVALSPFWSSLARQPPGRITIAVAPFRLEGHGWKGILWERASRQHVIPGFLSGGCAPWFFGETPLDPRFRWHNAVHLVDQSALDQRHVDYVAFDRRGEVIDAQGNKRAAPECEAWMRQRFGAPTFEDSELLVWAQRESQR